MESNNHLSDDIKDIAPTLYKIKKENPFSVPDNYFEGFPALIQEQCIKEKKEPWYKRFLHPKVSISLGCLILAFAIGINYYTNNLKSNSNTLMASFIIEADSLFIEDIDESILIELAADEPHERDEEKAALIDYLIEQNIDINQIIREL